MLNCNANDIYGDNGTSSGPSPPITESNQIISSDTTSSVTCNDGGTITSIGTFNFSNSNLINANNITGNPSVPFDIIQNNVKTEMQDDSYITYVDTLPRISADNSQSQLLSPNGTTFVTMTDDTFAVNQSGVLRYYSDGVDNLIVSPDNGTGMAIANDQVALATTTLGVVFYANSTSTAILANTAEIILQGGKIQNSSPLILPTNHDPTNPDIQYIDSPNTGLYSSSTGNLDLSCAGTNVANFNTTGTTLPNNTTTDKLTINGHYSLPITTPSNGQFIGVTGGNPSWISAFNGFQSFYTGSTISLAVNANTLNVCNILQLGSNYNTGTFTYTVPIRGIYQLNYSVSWFWTSTTNPANGRLDSAFKIIDGSTTFPGYTISETYAALLTAQPFRGTNTMSYYQQLNAGATVQLSISNNSSANNVILEMAYFGGRLIQEN